MLKVLSKFSFEILLHMVSFMLRTQSIQQKRW